MNDRVQCSSTHVVTEDDGRSRRLRCERSTWLPRRVCGGPHRAELGPPTASGPNGALVARVASWA